MHIAMVTTGIFERSLQALHFVDAFDCGDMLHDGLKLLEAVHGKLDAHSDYVVGCLGVDAVHGEMQLIGDAVHQVHEKVIPHHCLDLDRHGVKGVVRLKIDRHDAVATLRGETYGQWAIALVQRDGAVVASETNHLLARHRPALLAEMIARLLERLQVIAYLLFSLVGHSGLQPVGVGCVPPGR